MAIDLTIFPKTQLARRIADELGASDPAHRRQIRQIVLQQGKQYAVKLLLRTQKIEAEGGWFITDSDGSSNRRIPSEVFLRLHQIYQRPVMPINMNTGDQK